MRWAPASSEPWEGWDAAVPRSPRTPGQHQRELPQGQLGRPHAQWGSRSPRSPPRRGGQSALFVNSLLPPHSRSLSPAGVPAPCSTSTGLLEFFDSKGEQGQEGVTGGSDVHTPDWRRGRRLSNCCHASPTRGLGLGVMGELRGRVRSCGLPEAGGRAMGKGKAVGSREGFLPGLPVDGFAQLLSCRSRPFVAKRPEHQWEVTLLENLVSLAPGSLR